MIASFISLMILAVGLWIFSRASYDLGKDGLDRGAPSRRLMSVALSGACMVFLALLVNKTLE